MDQLSFVVRVACVAAALFFGADDSSGQERQTLTQQLQAEDAAALARDVMSQGDPVRGAIWFSQKTLQCTKCHAQGQERLLGPDLTQIDPVEDPSLLIESILWPSKKISRGYETTSIRTEDGRVYSGRIIGLTAQEFTLRQADKPDKLVRIARAEIEERKTNTASAMPEGLADGLEGRSQFLDLVRYLMQIAGTEKDRAVALDSGHAEGQVDERIRGLALLDHHSCTQCHSSLRHSDQVLPAKSAPNLRTVASRINADYLRRFIRDPAHAKPGTSMPAVMTHLPEPQAETAAKAITHYLTSLTDQSFKPAKIDSAMAQRGERAFHAVGCVACHAPRDRQAQEKPLEGSVAMGEVHQKYSLESLTAFLEDPLSVRVSGRMPNLKLSHWEANDIASYLLQQQTIEPSEITPDAELVAEGKRYFKQLRCNACHETDQESVAEDVPIEDLDGGCMSDQIGDWPVYSLGDDERAAIIEAVRQVEQPLTAVDQITLSMQSLRCYACHQRDGIGGPAGERESYFATTNENLGPQGRIPPRLTGVGGKLKPKWLREVLVAGRSIRPYVLTRMPQYGKENVESLVDLFHSADERPDAESFAFRDVRETKKAATELVGSRGLNCVACHTYQYKPAQTMPGVDLTEMGERLTKEWFHAYMRSPQAFSPGTVMPSFWPGGKAIRKDQFEGDTTKQISAVWEYLQDGRQARMPRGVRLEPMELLASEEKAVMLRRGYQGIGKRGIGVGYPSQINIAFDAEQMRLALMWKGGFADPGGVWRGQGHGSVRTLGRPVRFEIGPDLSDAASKPLAEGDRPANHQFKGYFLDERGRPTFMYRFKDVAVEDYFVDSVDESSGRRVLRRVIELESKSPREDLVFCIGSGKNVKDISGTKERVFELGDGLRVRCENAVRATSLDGVTRLCVPVNLAEGKSQLRVEYSW